MLWFENTNIEEYLIRCCLIEGPDWKIAIYKSYVEMLLLYIMKS